jgi:hypothetical protein
LGEGATEVKKSWIVLGIAVTFAAGLVVGNTVKADSGIVPGSVDDPVVTKSYVDEQLQQLQTGGGGASAATVALKVVSLQAGQSLIALEGTEFIPRAGKLTAIGSAGGGIPDLTGGKDLVNGAAVPLNHLLLFPRSDQRGVKATSNAVLMVRGAYQMINADGTMVPQTP